MKEYIIIAGPNGVGKSTIKRITRDFKGMEYINLDEIVFSVKASDDMHRFIKATQVAVERIDRCFRNNVSFVQESTLAGRSIRMNIQRAKDAGYKIIIHFIGVDSVNICKERIRHRVAAGGHGIPDADVERRYKRSFATINDLISDANEIYMYDNTKSFCKVAKYVAGKRIWQCDKLPKWFRKIS